MKIALITLSEPGAKIVQKLQSSMPEARCFFHQSVPEKYEGQRFDAIVDLTREIFKSFSGLVYVAPCGVAVRAVAGSISHKKVDPAVVCVDAGGRFAVSLLSGHEGGANDLAVKVANILGAEPVISTTTEALKRLTVGVGCKKGATCQTIIDAVTQALEKTGASLDQVRYLASADIKTKEKGLLEASEKLGIPLRLIASDEIRAQAKLFNASEFVQQKVSLPAVAEPAALLAARRSKLILPRTIINQIAVAVARENFLWSASDRAASPTGLEGPRTPSGKAAPSLDTKDILT